MTVDAEIYPFTGPPHKLLRRGNAPRAMGAALKQLPNGETRMEAVWSAGTRLPGGGIYVIRNRLNGWVYVGATYFLQSRWQAHLGALRRLRHANAALQRDWLFYGPTAFEFEVLRRFDWRNGRPALLAAEQGELERFQQWTVAYNVNAARANVAAQP